MEKRFYCAKDIGVYLGVSEDAVRKWALRGYIPFIKLGKSLRFDMIKVEVWLKNKECSYSRKEFN
jgi:excisionase family DNA binding protein